MIREHSFDEIYVHQGNHRDDLKPGDWVELFFGVRLFGLVIGSDPINRRVTVLWPPSMCERPFIDSDGNLWV